MSLIFLQKLFLGLLFFSINFEVWDPINSGGYFSLSKFFGILYFISTIVKAKQFLAIPRKLFGILLSIFIFYFLLVIANISNFTNINLMFGDIFGITILLNIFLFLIILNHERLVPGIIEKSFIWFLVGSLISTFAYFFGVGVEVEAGGRVSLFGDDENALGIRMVIAFTLLTHYIISYKNSIKWFYLIFMLLAYLPIVNLLFITGSRVAAISFLIVLSFYVFFYKAKNILMKPIIILIFIFSFSFIINLILSSEIVGKRLISTIEDGNLAGRDEIWKTILPLVDNNLILGVGQTGYKAFAVENFGGVKSPHNVIIEVLAYTGILGLIFYFYFILNCFFQGFKYYIRHEYLVPVIFVIPIFGLLLSGQLLTLKLAWFILAYCATRKYYMK